MTTKLELDAKIAQLATEFDEKVSAIELGIEAETKQFTAELEVQRQSIGALKAKIAELTNATDFTVDLSALQASVQRLEASTVKLTAIVPDAAPAE